MARNNGTSAVQEQAREQAERAGNDDQMDLGEQDDVRCDDPGALHVLNESAWGCGLEDIL